MRLTLFLILALVLCNLQSAIARDMDFRFSSKLCLLELKYFEHTFENDAAEERVQRIERLVLGDVSAGNPEARVMRLVTILDPNEDPNCLQETDSSYPRISANSIIVRSSSGDIDIRPQLVRLEKAILVHPLEGLSLHERMCKMELKAFGAISKSNDYVSRIDRLEAYSEQVGSPNQSTQDVSAGAGLVESSRIPMSSFMD